MMCNVKNSYKNWSKIYDSNINKTRDLDLKVSKDILSKISFQTVLEIGCGTGKNTLWLSEKAETIIAVDFSPEMLELAKNKIKSSHVKFIEADIIKPWTFITKPVDLISINLVLEHIENLDFIFSNAFKYLKKNGILYICELHPYKQYLGSQAKFEDNLVNSFTHHISDFVSTAKKHNLNCINIIESFDEIKKESEKKTPRLISFLFEK